MKQFIAILLFTSAMLFAGNAFASDNVQDITFSDKQCCCKAGCPSGGSGYFCRFMCTVLGGTCTRSASDFNGGDPTMRNSCMGASYHWWYGLTCPKTCPSNSSESQ